MATRGKGGRFAKKSEPEEEKVQLLSVENHPVLGQLQRWQTASGKVVEVVVK